MIAVQHSDSDQLKKQAGINGLMKDIRAARSR
jgi:hypothetical protein